MNSGLPVSSLTLKPGDLIQITNIAKAELWDKPKHAALYFEDEADPAVVDRLVNNPLLASVVNGMLGEYIAQSKAHNYRVVYVFDLDARILLNDEEFVALNEG